MSANDVNNDTMFLLGMTLLSAVTLAWALITGRAFNPLRGARPFVVSRAERPGSYWTSVSLNALGLAIIIFIDLKILWS